MTGTPPVITSRDNSIFKRIRSLQRSSIRNAERAFLVEGARAVYDAIQIGARPELVIIGDDAEEFASDERLSEIPFRLMDRRLIESLSDTVTPQGILAIFPFPDPPAPAISPELVLVIDALADPGNLGTLLRTAAAAGVARVLLTSGTVDPYNAKVVRSAMGAHFRVPIERLEPGVPLPDVTLLLLSATATTEYTSADMTGATWLVIGSEAHGIRYDFGGAPTQSVALPMPGGSESLNAAVAGSIVLYEALRQRSHSQNS